MNLYCVYFIINPQDAAGVSAKRRLKDRGYFDNSLRYIPAGPSV